MAKTEQNWCNFLLWGAASLRLTVLSTDTGLAVGTAEHFYTCYHEAIYVGIKEANGYTTIFDVWANYNFPYMRMKLLWRSPQIINQIVVSNLKPAKLKKKKKLLLKYSF